MIQFLGESSQAKTAFRKAMKATKSKSWSAAAGLWDTFFETASSGEVSADLLLKAAQVHRHAKNMKKARELLERAWKADPNNVDVLRELGRVDWTRVKKKGAYGERRKDDLYLHTAKSLCKIVSPNVSSVVDIGSHGTPILEWFPDAKRRVSVDLRAPYHGDGIESVKGDFLAWDPGARFQIATCFQVLEHVPDARSFAQKILEVCEVALISVPYKWSADTVRDHVHDPVDEEKVHKWFGREPNFSYIVKELHGPRRLLQVYDNGTKQKLRGNFKGDFLYRWAPPDLE